MLHAQIWPDTYVGDATLNVLIGEIRKAIDDNVREPRFIRTVHGVGYAFCGDVNDDTAPPRDAQTLLCWLTWKGTTFSSRRRRQRDRARSAVRRVPGSRRRVTAAREHPHRCTSHGP